MMHSIASWVMSTWVMQWVIKFVVPKVRFTVTPPRMNSGQYSAFEQSIQPGDLVFSVDRAKLSTVLIGGSWAHVGIVDSDKMIVEAHFPKSRRIHPAEFCFTSDVVALARPESTWVAEKLARRAKNLIGYPYDTFFQEGDRALYCSELVKQADYENELGFSPDADAGYDRTKIIKPDDLYMAENIILRRVFTPKMTVAHDDGSPLKWITTKPTMEMRIV